MDERTLQTEDDSLVSELYELDGNEPETAQEIGLETFQAGVLQGMNIGQAVAALEPLGLPQPSKLAAAKVFSKLVSAAGVTAAEQDTWVGQAMDLSELQERPEPREQLIEGFVEVSRLMMLFGKPGDFKTFLAMDAAVAIASGKPWLLDIPTVQSPVVFIQQDQGGQDTKDRLHALFNAYEVDPTDLPLFFYTYPRPSLDLLQNSHLLAEILRHHSARFCVVDNLFNTAGVRNENDSEIGLAVNNLGLIRELTGAHIMVVHHPSKAEGWSRGHGTILQNVDQSIKVVRSDRFVSFEPEKQRGAGMDVHIAAKFEYEHYADSTVMRTARFLKATQDDVLEDSKSELVELVVEFVDQNPQASKSVVERGVAGDSNSIRAILDSLVKTGGLIRSKGKNNAQLHSIPGSEPEQEEIPF